jgi:hypothetical protein
MKLIQKSLVIIFTILPAALQAELCLIDQINFVVCGPACNTPFPETYVTWKRVPLVDDQQFVPEAKQIQAEIVAQQVATEKMPMDPDAAAKYVEGIKKQLHVNDAELADLFALSGRTLTEGLEWFTNQYIGEFFTHYKFKSQLVPNDDEILQYFHDNPDFHDGFYEISIARVPYDTDERDVVKNKIEKSLNSHEDGKDLWYWGKPIKLSEDDISFDQKFIKAMKPEDIQIQESPGIFELIKLIACEPTRIKSLEERRSSIIDKLNRKKLEVMLQSYNDSVKDQVDIIVLEQPAAAMVEEN